MLIGSEKSIDKIGCASTDANLATPLFAMTFMAHLHKPLGGSRLIAP